MISLKRILVKDMKLLRTVCKASLESGGKSASERWLTDNYHLLVSESEGVFRALRDDFIKQNAGDIYEKCLIAFPDAALPDETELIAKIADMLLTAGEYAALPCALRAALLHCAGAYAKNGINNEDADGFSPLINAVRSIMKLRGIDFSLYGKKLCRTEEILCEDPSGDYPLMSERTRAVYRRKLSALAKKRGEDEKDTARDIIKQAVAGEHKHIGFYLGFSEKRCASGVMLLIMQIIVPFILSAVFAARSQSYAVFFVMFLPLYATVLPLFDWLARRFFSPREIFTMNTERGITKDNACVIVVSSILPPAAKAKSVAEHLSQVYAANANGHVSLILSADLKAAKSPTLPTDNADINAMKKQIDKLNEKYGGGFTLAVRERIFSPTGNDYTGSERKRGAINAIVSYLSSGSGAGFLCLHGDTKKLTGAKYIFALDSDTQPSFDALTSLVAAASHPMNKAITDTATRRVVSGYGIFMPKIENALVGNTATFFSKIMTGGGGISAYNPRVSEKYFDLFGNTVFSGKGLIDIAVYNTLLPDAFPAQRILSHDVLEGGILRTAFVSEAVLTDSFPVRERSYFARLHRWIRGDWQNAGFIISPLDGRNGVRSLPLLTKYMLTDNIRRSLLPVCAIVLIASAAAFSYPYGLIMLLVAALSVSSGELLNALTSFFTSGLSVFSRLYFSDAVPAALGCAVRAFACVAILPEECFVCADAIIRAFHRTHFSHKKLLEWTTASEADANAYKKPMRSVFPPLVIATFLFLLSGGAGRLLAICFLINIPFSLSSGTRTHTRTNAPGETEREILTAFASRIWSFFKDTAGANDNYLPVDNIQEAPAAQVAHRTSPTNIGLMLCCALAAADFSFIDAKELQIFLSHSLDSIEKLEKWNGNLLNWYDTTSLRPLEPRYVSTVDSGNFLVCLTALYEGLADCTAACPELENERERIKRLIDKTQLGPLFNKSRNLFYVGFDIGENAPSPSCYDVFMSEARMTSFFAVARREVPASHWGALSRTLVSIGRYAGAASWTGTAFEYLMPLLFLPSYANSFSTEAVGFALYAQKKHAEKLKLPAWGFSESGFYAFDSSLAYRYKAHGVGSLALKRGADEDAVVSPYSAFLALGANRHSALRDIAALSSLHMTGQYGLYEAADFCRSRCGNQDYRIVRSYMAHHQGMSMLACANAVFGDIFVKRFIKNDTMRAPLGLLKEKIPNGRVFRDIVRSAKAARPSRPDSDSSGREAFTSLGAYSNGEWTLLFTKGGKNRLLYNNIDMTGKTGISAAVTATGDTIEILDSAEPLSNCAFSDIQTEKIRIRSALLVHPSKSSVLFPVRADTKERNGIHARLHVYFEPFLHECFFEDNHPSFSKLFIKTEYDCSTNSVIFSTKTKNGAHIYFAAGFVSGRSFMLETDREKAVPRSFEGEKFDKTEFGKTIINLSTVDPCAAITAELNVTPDSPAEEVLILTAGSGREQTLFSLLETRQSKLPDISDGANNPFIGDSLTCGAAALLLSEAFFNAPVTESVAHARELFEGGLNELWQTGISGDFPIAVITADSPDDPGLLSSYIRLHKLLALSGIRFDFAVVFTKNMAYGDTAEKILSDALLEQDCLSALSARAGIHAFNRNALPKDAFLALIASASAVFPDDGLIQTDSFSLASLSASPVLPSEEGSSRFIENGYLINSTPPREWCHTLSNASFGTLLSDRGTVYTWAMNSRENKLTEWANETRVEKGCERIFVKTEKALYDVCMGASVSFTDENAVYSGFSDKLIFRLTVEVAKRGCKKRLLLTVENASEKERNISAVYFTKPLLASSPSLLKYLKAERTENGVIARNTANRPYPGYSKIYISGENTESFTSMLELSNFLGAEQSGCTDSQCAAVLKTFALAPGEMVQIEFGMAFAVSRQSLEKLIAVPFENREPPRLRTFSGDEMVDEFSSALLVHQTLDTRFLARTGFRQCSGARGFRDQLQDSLALLDILPRLTKQQIYRSAAAQFPEGDVLHWFHAQYNSRLVLRGVRTRCSDDLLWLPLAVAEYVEKTGDQSILFAEIPYLEGEPLKKNEKDRYAEYSHSAVRESLYSHCIRAIRHSLRFGTHSLPLILGGDWNDSFGEVGTENDGESVWLAMFLALVLERYSNICDLLYDEVSASEFRSLAVSLKNNIDEFCWTGDRYIRAFYADGTVMGDESSDACKIDILPQAFAVFCGMPDRERRVTALKTACSRLIDREYGIVRLFDAPFTENTKHAGYVNDYPAGVRENAGQYTHAAVWLAKACCKEQLFDEAAEILRIICPAVKYRSEKDAAVYLAEPYALCGDVYSKKGMRGRGGWSLYTGAAGRYLDAVSLLGKEIRQRENPRPTV